MSTRVYLTRGADLSRVEKNVAVRIVDSTVILILTLKERGSLELAGLEGFYAGVRIAQMHTPFLLLVLIGGGNEEQTVPPRFQRTKS